MSDSTETKPPPTFSKYPNEVEITFQRKNGEIITEIVHVRAKIQTGGKVIYLADREMFDADKPGSQHYAELPEDSVAKAAEEIAKIVHEDGIYKAVVRVDDTGRVMFLEVGSLSKAQFDLQKTLQREIRRQKDEKSEGNE